MISHTITVNEWKSPVENILNQYNWTTCCAESDKGGIYASQDVIRDFTYFTLDRLIQVLNSMESTGKSFHDLWRECSEPNRIKFSINENGDSKINLITNNFNKKQP